MWAGLLPPWAVSPRKAGGVSETSSSTWVGKVDVDGGPFVEDHFDDGLFLEVVQRVAEKPPWSIRTGQRSPGPGSSRRSRRCRGTGPGGCPCPPGRTGYRTAGMCARRRRRTSCSWSLMRVNGRALLHLVTLVVHDLPGLAVQLDYQTAAEVAEVDAHLQLPAGVMHGPPGVRAAGDYLETLLRATAPSSPKATMSSMRTPPQPEI